MKRLSILAGSLAAIAFLSASNFANADELADIKARGTLICGVVTALQPFGYQDTDTRQVSGYDIDFCKGIAAAMGVKPEIKVVAVDARIPELLQGRVDVLAAILGFNKPRAEQIAFSKTYFVSRQIIAVKSDSPYKKRDDMAGKRVSAIKGSSGAAMMQAVLPTAQLINYDDGPSAFMALVQNKVDGFLLSESLMKRFIDKLGSDSRTITVIEPPVGTEYWGIGVKKGESALLAAVNKSLESMESSGQSQEIFDKWLGNKSALKMTRQFKVSDIPGNQ
jgi:polar amino acid transport system substrate-binding protein